MHIADIKFIHEKVVNLWYVGAFAAAAFIYYGLRPEPPKIKPPTKTPRQLAEGLARESWEQKTKTKK